MKRARDEVLARLTMVVEAPTNSRIRVVTDEEVRDEPNFFLSRSADVFRHRASQLLSASDLKYLWQHRSALEIDNTAAELIFHSALRRRATLWLWLAALGLSSRVVERLLNRSLELRDRDKSDAARSMLQVAAVFLDDSGFERIRAALAATEYAHMRTAAEELDDRASAVATLPGGSTAGDADLANMTIDELLDLALQVMDEPDQLVSRRLPAIGLGILLPVSRHLTGGGQPGFYSPAGDQNSPVPGGRWSR